MVDSLLQQGHTLCVGYTLAVGNPDDLVVDTRQWAEGDTRQWAEGDIRQWAEGDTRQWAEGDTRQCVVVDIQSALGMQPGLVADWLDQLGVGNQVWIVEDTLVLLNHLEVLVVWLCHQEDSSDLDPPLGMVVVVRQPFLSICKERETR